MKVLIIKLTSMGDLMHALPALTEASNAFTDISFDWVVDENFSEVPKWHPNVKKVITTNHREWRKQFFSSSSRLAFKNLIKDINHSEYDFVIDMQNNIKSAFVSYLCKQNITGMDYKSVREFPAQLSYSTQFNVPKNLHAVTRQNKLLAKALNYEENIKISNYGISKNNFLDPKLNLPSKFAVLVQNASWPSKQWPVNKWQKLINCLDQLDIYTFLPSGNATELERAKEIASCSEKAIALELMSLNEIAFLIDKADFSVCSDTGLAHLSAVVGTPSITLYGPTDVKLIGTYGENQEHIIAENKDINNIKVDEVVSKLPKIEMLK